MPIAKTTAIRFGSIFAFVLIASRGYGATVAGTVKGPDGAAFKGAFVQAQNTPNRMSFSVLSDKDGKYRIENLPAGTYSVQVKASGYKADPQSGVRLAADQNATFDLALQTGIVRWNELSMHQGKVLFPEGKGKDILVQRCWACHGFETRMASVTRDEEGWKDRVAYMRDAMGFFLNNPRTPFTDEMGADVAALHEFALRLRLGPPEVSRRHAEVQGRRASGVRRRGDEDRLRRIRSAGAEPHALERRSGQGRQLVDAVLRTGQHDRPARPADGGGPGVSSSPSDPCRGPLCRAGSRRFRVVDRAGHQQRLGHWDPATRKITEFQDDAGKHTARVGPTGEIWFSGSQGSLRSENRQVHATTAAARTASRSTRRATPGMRRATSWSASTAKPGR